MKRKTRLNLKIFKNSISSKLLLNIVAKNYMNHFTHFRDNFFLQNIYQKQLTIRRHFNIHRDIFRIFFNLNSLIHIAFESTKIVVFQIEQNTTILEHTNVDQSAKKVIVTKSSNAKSMSNDTRFAKLKFDTNRIKSISNQSMKNISHISQDTSETKFTIRNETTIKQMKQFFHNSSTQNITTTNANQTKCNNLNVSILFKNNNEQISNV